MKKSVLLTAAALSFCANVAFAEQVKDWRDLEEVHNHIQAALHEMEVASKANHYDMGGHAAKAEEYLRQAEHEMHEALASAEKAK